MKILIYAGAELMTGDDIADAVLEFCAALAEASAAETIEIPVVGDDGTIRGARLLLGPSSEIVAQQVETTWPELDDPQTLQLLATRTRAQHPAISVRPRPAEGSGYQAWTDSI